MQQQCGMGRHRKPWLNARIPSHVWQPTLDSDWSQPSSHLTSLPSQSIGNGSHRRHDACDFVMSVQGHASAVKTRFVDPLKIQPRVNGLRLLTVLKCLMLQCLQMFLRETDSCHQSISSWGCGPKHGKHKHQLFMSQQPGPRRFICDQQNLAEFIRTRSEAVATICKTSAASPTQCLAQRAVLQKQFLDHILSCCQEPLPCSSTTYSSSMSTNSTPAGALPCSTYRPYSGKKKANLNVLGT